MPFVNDQSVSRRVSDCTTVRLSRRVRRRMLCRVLAGAACCALLPCAGAGGAILDVFWIPVGGQPNNPFPNNAIWGNGGDPRLLDMQSWDLSVYCDGNWSSAGLRAVLPAGNGFYHSVFGGNTKPSPTLETVFPAVAYDTYVTAPADTGNSGAPAVLGGFPEQEPVDFGGTSGVFSVSWGDTVNDAPGTYRIARLTFPKTVFPSVLSIYDVGPNGPYSRTSQVNPDLTVPIQPFGFPTTNRWLPDADGSWHHAGNWSQGIEPGTSNVFVTLDVGGPTVRTITHSHGMTAVHGITAQEHILLSGGTIGTINGLNLANGLTLDGGALRGRVVGSAILVGANGGRLQEAHVGSALSHSTAATLVVHDGLTLDGAATFGALARVRFQGSDRHWRGSGTAHFEGGVIDVDAGAALTMAGNLRIRKTGDSALRINGYFTTGGNAAIDLAAGGIVNDYAGPSPLDNILSLIISGYDDGNWNGPGINSSTAASDASLAVGYAEAGAIFGAFPATFMGETIDATTLLLRLVRSGDANLDGVVNLADFNRLASNFGSANAFWHTGDFNYDGVVNLADFNLLAANFGLSASSPEGPTPDDWANLAAAVPEPGVLSLWALGAVGLLRRSRRSR